MITKIIIIVLLIVAFIFIIFKFNYKDMTYIKSDIDGNLYLVRDVPDKQNAANTLAELKNRILYINKYLLDNIKTKECSGYEKYIEQLNNKIQNVVIIESTADSIYTSYSVNKGEQIVFCIRSRKDINKLHDINLMMYVVLHEMSHVACPEYGHTELFKKIFSFFAITAVKLNLYNKIDFQKSPEEYCGMIINDSVI